MMSALRCPICEETYPADPGEPWRCPRGHPLEFVESVQASGEPPALGLSAIGDGLWTFGDLLPVDPLVTLGEGWTPLVPASAWDATFKLEYLFPTGSFKDRGATTTVSRAAALEVDTILEDSSGNAGAAIATYAARAGIDARIFVPSSTPAAKRQRITQTGADLVVVPGDRAAATAACIDAVEAGKGWYGSHAWHPAFYAGTATFAFEVAAQRGWSAPDAVVLPVGHGTLFLGAIRGFEALVRAGWIESMPRMLAVQAAGTAPLVAAIRSEAAAAGTNTVADGVQIEAPARFDALVEAVETTDGDAIAVEGESTERALEQLQTAGFAVEPTAALAPAGLDVYRSTGVIEASEDVVIPLTGMAKPG
ncbi:MAG: pyridoxal-phosphate dependent enzyme [Halobacteriaceae archaeon]